MLQNKKNKKKVLKEIKVPNLLKGDKILLNAIQCKHCREIIISIHVHDFKWCKCKAVAVDGGKDYLKRVGKFEDMIERSISE